MHFPAPFISRSAVSMIVFNISGATVASTSLDLGGAVPTHPDALGFAYGAVTLNARRRCGSSAPTSAEAAAFRCVIADV
jgi:hypothetical protein